MKFRDRNTVTEPAILHKRYPPREGEQQGKTETERALEHYAPPWDGTQYEFKRYSEDDVKRELEALFHGKCAYCEWKYGAGTPQDVEHWRPKGAVILEDGTEKKPAYYWLAATWSNLLPSCPDCNRKRRQEDARDPANEQSGKKNLFPVRDEHRRWTHPDQPNRNGEEPLILDPCRDHPEDYLKVDDEAVINERHPDGTLENLRARKSIDVFGLNRVKLVEERQEARGIVQVLLNDVRLAALQLPELADGEVKEMTRETLETKLSMLKKQRGDKSEFLLMKEPLIDGFIAEMGPKLQELGFAV